jgi:carboxymethylenebutenolidase
MTREFIDIGTTDGSCDSYVSYPDTGGPFPAVIFYMDGIGIRPVLREMADRIAEKGFYVLLPNTYYRRGRAPLFDVASILKPENRATLMDLVLSVTPELVQRDAGAFLEFLAQRPQVRPHSKVGLTGYCMGGAMVMRTAAQYADRIAAGASFHGGGLATDAPGSPHLLAGLIKAELYFGHADNDHGMPPASIARLDAALDAAAVRYQSELYVGAAHGFTMTDLPVYDEPASRRHWDRLLALYGRTLQAV